MNGCDFEKAMIPLFIRSPYLEMEAMVTDKLKVPEDPNPMAQKMMEKIFFHSVDFVEELPSPRQVYLLLLWIQNYIENLKIYILENYRKSRLLHQMQYAKLLVLIVVKDALC